MAQLRRKALTFAVCALALACRRPPTPTVAPLPVPAPLQRPAPPPQPGLPVPRVPAAIALDGELAETVWREALHSGPFKDTATGALAVPHSELRLAHDGQRLLLGLYAADENIAVHGKGDGEDDGFLVQIQNVGGGASYVFSVAANSVVREGPLDAPVGKTAATCALEMDGTLNDAADDDEEWVAECLVPMAPLSAKIGDTLEVTVKRCDTPKNATRRCGLWHERVQLQ